MKAGKVARHNSRPVEPSTLTSVELLITTTSSSRDDAGTIIGGPGTEDVALPVCRALRTDQSVTPFCASSAYVTPSLLVVITYQRSGERRCARTGKLASPIAARQPPLATIEFAGGFFGGDEIDAGVGTGMGLREGSAA